jgi:hypothetical protein
LATDKDVGGGGLKGRSPFGSPGPFLSHTGQSIWTPCPKRDVDLSCLRSRAMSCTVCETKGTKRCSLCHEANYRPAPCQKKHWPEHKRECWKIQVMSGMDMLSGIKLGSIQKYRLLGELVRKIPVFTLPPPMEVICAEWKVRQSVDAERRFCTHFWDKDEDGITSIHFYRANKEWVYRNGNVPSSRYASMLETFVQVAHECLYGIIPEPRQGRVQQSIPQCIVCMEKACSVFLLTCKHCQMCKDCTQTLLQAKESSKCPTCWTPFTQTDVETVFF